MLLRQEGIRFLYRYERIPLPEETRDRKYQEYQHLLVARFLFLLSTGQQDAVQFYVRYADGKERVVFGFRSDSVIHLRFLYLLQGSIPPALKVLLP